MPHTIMVKATKPQWHDVLKLWWVEFAWPVPNEERDYSVVMTHEVREILEATVIRAYADGAFDIYAPEGVPLDGFKQLKIAQS